jgi:hypothetical protein
MLHDVLLLYVILWYVIKGYVVLCYGITVCSVRHCSEYLFFTCMVSKTHIMFLPGA